MLRRGSAPTKIGVLVAHKPTFLQFDAWGRQLQCAIALIVAIVILSNADLNEEPTRFVPVKGQCMGSEAPLASYVDCNRTQKPGGLPPRKSCNSHGSTSQAHVVYPRPVIEDDLFAVLRNAALRVVRRNKVLWRYKISAVFLECNTMRSNTPSKSLVP